MINRLIVLSFIEIKTVWSLRCRAFRHRVPVGRPDLDGLGRPGTCRCQQLACAGGYGVEPYGKNAVHGRCGIYGLRGATIRTKISYPPFGTFRMIGMRRRLTKQIRMTTSSGCSYFVISETAFRLRTSRQDVESWEKRLSSKVGKG